MDIDNQITQEEVDETLNKCVESEMNGTKWPAATYEQGVKETLMWLMGEVGNPMED